jgi:hypothetical protein
MKVTELITGFEDTTKSDSKYNLLSHFEVWTTNEEAQLLKKLKEPVKINRLSEHEQFTVAAMIRKSLITKIGHTDPSVVANEKTK